MKTSTNYGLKLPEGTDNVKRQDIVDNFEKIDLELKNNVNKAKEVENKVNNIKIVDGTTTTKGIVKLNNSTTSTSQVEAATPLAVKIAMDRANQAFQSASNGKVLISNAVTGKGVQASKDDSFEELANKIRSITTGKLNVGSIVNPNNFIVDTKKLCSINSLFMQGQSLNFKVFGNEIYIYTLYVLEKYILTGNTIKKVFTKDLRTFINNDEDFIASLDVDLIEKVVYVLISSKSYIRLSLNGDTIDKKDITLNENFSYIKKIIGTSNCLVLSDKNLRLLSQDKVIWVVPLSDLSSEIYVDYDKGNFWIVDEYYFKLKIINIDGKIELDTEVELERGTQLAVNDNFGYLYDGYNLIKKDKLGETISEVESINIHNLLVYDGKIYVYYGNLYSFDLNLNRSYQIRISENLGNIDGIQFNGDNIIIIDKKSVELRIYKIGSSLELLSEEWRSVD